MFYVYYEVSYGAIGGYDDNNIDVHFSIIISYFNNAIKAFPRSCALLLGLTQNIRKCYSTIIKI